jgi:type IV pilus assembly protein PilP
MLLVFLAVLVGCTEEPKATPPNPVSAPVKVSNQQPMVSTPTVTAVPVQAPPAEVYTYRPAGRRDPFAPIISKAQVKPRINVPPLERYDINEFKLTGIIWGGFGYNAMLDGPDGKGYFVRVGTIIGPNRGVIKKITQHTLVIEEKFKNVMGEVERKEIIVELRSKQEEKP